MNETLQAILEKYGWEQGQEIENEDLFCELFDYFREDMPYGTKKGRDGDPYMWIEERLEWLVVMESSQQDAVDGNCPHCGGRLNHYGGVGLEYMYCQDDCSPVGYDPYDGTVTVQLTG